MPFKLIILTVLSLFVVMFGGCSPNESRPRVRDFSLAGKNRVWIVSSTGKAFMIEGESRAMHLNDVPSDAANVFFIDELTGWILDSAGSVWTTADGGKSWIQEGAVADKNEPTSMVFVDSKIGWIITRGNIWLSEDGGSNWSRSLQIADTFALRSILSPVSADVAWLSVEGKKILKTEDRGRTWKTLEFESPSSITGLFALSGKECFIVTSHRGGIYRTLDGGSTWKNGLSVKETKQMNLQSVLFGSNSTGWAVGRFYTNKLTDGRSHGVVLMTKDGGNTWEKMQSVPAESDFRQIKTVDQRTIWLVGHDSVYRTNDGGLTWKKFDG